MAARLPHCEDRTMAVLFRTACTVVALWAATSSSVTPPAAPTTRSARSKPEFAGKVQEWPVPTPEFARDPAPAPDGSIYITVMHGNKIARFDPASEKFKEWDLPRGAHPHGLLVDGQGTVWYTGNGNGTIGHLDPTTGKVTEYQSPLGRRSPHPGKRRQGHDLVHGAGRRARGPARHAHRQDHRVQDSGDPTGSRSTQRATCGSAAWARTSSASIDAADRAS